MRSSRVAISFAILVILSLTISGVISDDTHNEEAVRDGITTESPLSNTTTAAPTSKKLPVWTGFIGCLVASLFFGSNLLPVKQFSAGDGFFFQFVFCVSVWVVGMILDLILGNEHFYPLVLIGGVLWTTGNLVTVFCIKTCGLSVGLLIWGTTSLIMGWAGGRFGIFGVTPQVPSSNSKLALNYLGVIFAAISGIFFLFIKSTNTPKESAYSKASDGQEEVQLDKIGLSNINGSDEETDFPFLNRLSEKAQKIMGCALAALAGLFYGLMFIPDQYIRDHEAKYTIHGEPPPADGLYYIHSQYSGILISSVFYFVVYAVFKRNKPTINPSIAVPAMVSGLMWGIANIGFSVAISTLTGSVAYPIVSVLPGIVSSLWSLFWFHEIQGKRNLIFLGCGMLLRILAAVFSALSS